MYKRFYGFRKEPFSIVPDPDFLYLSPTHREALAQLIYGIQSKKGFIVVTGEVGVGKTTIINAFLEKLEQANVITAFIFNPRLEPMEFFQLLCDDLGLPKPTTKADFLTKFHSFLIDCYLQRKIVVLIIDEAHELSPQLLEEIRLLLNLETKNEKLLQVILSGQPELWEKLRTPQLRQLKQRITLRHKIEALSKSETEIYIKERLQKAGGDKDIFTPNALNKIYLYSNGIPRIINVICTNALISGYASDQKRIGEKIIDEVIADLDLSLPAPKQKSPEGTKGNKWKWAITTSIIALFLVFLGFYSNKLLKFAAFKTIETTSHNQKKSPVRLPSPSTNTPKQNINTELRPKEIAEVVETKVVEKPRPITLEPINQEPIKEEIPIMPEGVLYTLYSNFGFVNNQLVQLVKRLNPEVFNNSSKIAKENLIIPSDISLPEENMYAIYIFTTDDFSKAEQKFWRLIQKGHQTLLYNVFFKGEFKHRIVIGQYKTWKAAFKVAEELVAQNRLSQSIIIKIPTKKEIESTLRLRNKSVQPQAGDGEQPL